MDEAETNRDASQAGESDLDLSKTTDYCDHEGRSQFTQFYRVLRPLACGGFGELFVAEDCELGREVALKVIQSKLLGDPQITARFGMEAEITGRLEHPGVVPIYALGRQPDGRPFYTMRLIRGESLKDQIRQLHRKTRGPGSRAELYRLLQIFARVCEVLAYAHSRGILHRDIKPSNIMVGKYGEVLVVHSGLAKVIGRAEIAAGGPLADELTLHPASGMPSNPRFTDRPSARRTT